MRRGLVLAGSLAVHALVLIVIGLQRQTLTFAPPPPTRTLELILTPDGARPQAAASGAPSPRVRPASQPRTAVKERPAVAPSPAPPETAEAAPSAPAGGGAPVAAPGAGVGGGAEAVRSALRAGLGCAGGAEARLSLQEKERCLERYGMNARKGPAFIDPIPQEKRAYYDAVQAAYQAAKDPMHPFVRDANGDVQPWGRGPGVGCGMKFGGPPPKPDHRSLTDKIKAEGALLVDVGPLRCGLILPQGALTPELGIPVP